MLELVEGVERVLRFAAIVTGNLLHDRQQKEGTQNRAEHTFPTDQLQRIHFGTADCHKTQCKTQRVRGQMTHEPQKPQTLHAKQQLILAQPLAGKKGK
jgi:hypothetical protein